MSNFDFFSDSFPILEKLGKQAEHYLYTDTDSCIYKLGKLAETIVHEMMYLDNIPHPDEDTLINQIKVLRKEGLLPREIDDILYRLRTVRNKAVHTNEEDIADCEVLLKMAHSLSIWFMHTYGKWDYVPEPFALPVSDSISFQPESDTDAEYEQILAKRAGSSVASAISISERVKLANKAASQLVRSEEETRQLIDEQLRKVGWEADTMRLRYSKGTRPEKGRNLAIAEWPTDSTVGRFGKADYALFAGLQFVGIVEAKAEHKDISSVIDYQCKDYPRNIREKDKQYTIGQWGQYWVPFTFATNGRPYLKQLETKSGIWFLDLRDSSNISKALQGWMSPDNLLELLEKDIEAANRELQQTPFDLLRDRDGLNLRSYQIQAIEAAEQAITDGQGAILLSMATGTGKTRTILGLIYRLISAKRFRRVLFLVDRTALGEQAQDVFQDVKIEDLMTLNDIYNIKNLEEKGFDKETRIQIATVQSMVKRILYNEEDAMPAVSDYDLIIVDEAHRGYIVDKEISDSEFLYRDQKDYVSKYRTVIEYFDAVKIAMTATPAVHTSEIFGKPVFNYTYRQAVIDGWLVDHDAPHIIETKLSKEDIIFEKGEIVPIYDPVTKEITNSDELEDELRFDVEKFNKQVITEPFNRTVLEEIARDIDPEAPEQGKTLIYAVDDQHADLIVKILKEIYGELGVDNNAIMKITGSVGGGNKKKVLEAIKRFKVEDLPSVVVTVDLLTTGVDVPEISTLVFMRRVKSRILFEQMMGRATRLCPKIKKTHFEIYDAVGVYESLEPVSNMKPVVVNPSASFEDLLNGLSAIQSQDEMQNQINMILAKIQRKKRNLSNQASAHFTDLSGGLDPTQFIQKIQGMTPDKAKQFVLDHDRLFQILNEGGLNPRRAVVISHKEDELVGHSRGYGRGMKPKDYLEEFESYVQSNLNRIAALNIVCARPSELTRDSLKSLKLELDREGFTEQQLNTAYREMSNEDITADIISFIRRHAIGSVLMSHEERIKRAVDKVRKNHDFSKQELNWLARIEKHLLNESVLNVQTFDEDVFQDNGGYVRINKVFRGNLEAIVREINTHLYDDGGHTA